MNALAAYMLYCVVCSLKVKRKPYCIMSVVRRSMFPAVIEHFERHVMHAFSWILQKNKNQVAHCAKQWPFYALDMDLVTGMGGDFSGSNLTANNYQAPHKRGFLINRGEK
ncbi:TPA: hypothetical protein ACHVFW_001677 [Shigella sonnei]|nr:hypothetical protein [Escherichia coli]EEZ5551863.1 hypothetical protein [Escherichia coli]